jgi:hypothetical protein
MKEKTGIERMHKQTLFMNKSKKGFSLAWNQLVMMVLAVIALIILVIIAFQAGSSGNDFFTLFRSSLY